MMSSVAQTGSSFIEKLRLAVADSMYVHVIVTAVTQFRWKCLVGIRYLRKTLSTLSGSKVDVTLG
jgi:hypothetical protein